MGLQRRAELKRKPMAKKPPKPKTCAICTGEFVPQRAGQKVCCPVPCGVEYARQQEAKKKAKERHARRAKTRAELEAMKTISDLTKEAREKFNAFIRELDEGRPCVSSGALTAGDHLTGGSWDCGHFRTVGAQPALRFVPLNAHRQRKHDNRDKSGAQDEQRKTLLRWYGEEIVAWLERDYGQPQWRHDDLREIREHYAAERRRLRADRRAGKQWDAIEYRVRLYERVMGGERVIGFP